MKRLALLGLLLVFALPASATRLPILASKDWWPVVSPDGTKIAFTTLNGQGRVLTLEVVDARTRAVRRLAQSSSQLAPSWSPDSTRIAYQSGGRIWTVGVDGTGRKDVADGFYPAWSPDGKTIAFVQGGVVHAGAARFGHDVVAAPAWSHDGTRIAFVQSDGIDIETIASGAVTGLAAPGPEVRGVYWSPDDSMLAYVAGRWVYTVATHGPSQPQIVAGPFDDAGPLAWASTPDALAFTAGGYLERTSLDGGVRTERLARTTGVGVSYAQGDRIVYSGPDPACTGHTAILQYRGGMLAGSCTITGTARADVIDATAQGGDVILAGAGNDTIDARNGHRDTVNCGPGRDTVRADPSDRLVGCEIVHH